MNLIALFAAIVAVESGGNDLAVGDGGKAVGPAQIWAITVKDVNRIAGTNYTLADRTCRKKSMEMFVIYTDHYGKRYGWPVSDEVRARIWNGGPSGPSKPQTATYWKKVKGRYETAIS